MKKIFFLAIIILGIVILNSCVSQSTLSETMTHVIHSFNYSNTVTELRNRGPWSFTRVHPTDLAIIYTEEWSDVRIAVVDETMHFIPIPAEHSDVDNITRVDLTDEENFPNIIVSITGMQFGIGKSKLIILKGELAEADYVE